MKTKITLIDYDLGNIFSVFNALNKADAEVLVTSNPRDLAYADRVVLPGVGSFASAMKNLQRGGWIDEIKKYCSTERPFLGICIGMQVLLERSEEATNEKGLSLIPGTVQHIRSLSETPRDIKVPHMGWSQLSSISTKTLGHEKLNQCLGTKNYYYFVHSYACLPTDTSQIIATVEYEGLNVPAMIGFDNILGVQFHPEKSGVCGLKFLTEFLSI